MVAYHWFALCILVLPGTLSHTRHSFITLKYWHRLIYNFYNVLLQVGRRLSPPLFDTSPRRLLPHTSAIMSTLLTSITRATGTARSTPTTSQTTSVAQPSTSSQSSIPSQTTSNIQTSSTLTQSLSLTQNPSSTPPPFFLTNSDGVYILTSANVFDVVGIPVTTLIQGTPERPIAVWNSTQVRHSPTTSRYRKRI